MQNKIFQIEKQKVIEEEELRTKEEILKQSIEELNKITNELNNLGGIVNNTLKDQEQQLMEKYYKVMSKKQETEKTTKQEINNKEKLETKIDELEASFRLNNTAVRTLENNLKEYEISNTKSSVKMDNLLSILSETYQMTFEKAKENYILEIDEEIARKNVNEYKRVIKNIGVVNVASIEEYDRINTRYEFMKKQNNDLKEASEKLLEINNIFVSKAPLKIADIKEIEKLNCILNLENTKATKKLKEILQEYNVNINVDMMLLVFL